MKLGNYMTIVRQCQNLQESAAFFQKLGLEILEEKKLDEQAILLTDGRMHLLLQKMHTNQTRFQYFTDHIQNIKDQLDGRNILYIPNSEPEMKGVSHISMIDPNNFKIVVQEIQENQKFPDFTNNPRGDSIVELGNFGEFAIATQNYEETKNFWLQLGFTPLVEEADPYPWGIFSDNLVVIGIHQAIDFDVPTFTYFKVGMQKVIDELQAKGIPFENPENGTTKSPDGQQIFFFEGDIK